CARKRSSNPLSGRVSSSKTTADGSRSSTICRRTRRCEREHASSPRFSSRPYSYIARRDEYPPTSAVESCWASTAGTISNGSPASPNACSTNARRSGTRSRLTTKIGGSSLWLAITDQCRAELLEIAAAEAPVRLQVVALGPLVPRLHEDQPVVVRAVFDEIERDAHLLTEELRRRPVEHTAPCARAWC